MALAEPVLLKALDDLSKLPITHEVFVETNIGKIVERMTKFTTESVARRAAALVNDFVTVYETSLVTK